MGNQFTGQKFPLTVFATASKPVNSLSMAV